jgi:hypothetical protein
MFAQVIHGRTSDPEFLRAATDRWVEELSPGATGWLGSTGGVTDDGRFVVVVRFESAEAARRNSDRPEQGRWWEETSRSLSDVTFLDSDDVTVDLTGDPGRAGFVQVMQGRVSDPDRARKIMAELPQDLMTKYRPDVLGSVMVGAADGRWVQVVYFTSEEEARAGERQEPPAEMVEAMQEMGSLSVGETEFFDLRRPVLHSPG